MSKLFKISVVLCIFLILIIVVTVSSFNILVKKRIERFIENALALPVNIDHVYLNPFKMSIELFDITISNPSQFDKLNFASVKTIKISPNFLSLFSSKITINTIEIQDIKINLEIKESTNNYKTILSKLDNFKTNQSAEKKKKFNIEELIITNLDLHTKLSVFEAGGIIEYFKMQNIGNYSDDSSEIVADVFERIYNDVIKGKIAKTSLNINKTLYNVKDKIKDIFSTNIAKSNLN